MTGEFENSWRATKFSGMVLEPPSWAASRCPRSRLWESQPGIVLLVILGPAFYPSMSLWISAVTGPGRFRPSSGR
jgi:hypothetical protein